MELKPPPRAGQYRTIVADSPWPERGGGRIVRGAQRHYQVMTVAQIAALPVASWAASNAHLYLWVTNNYLEHGFRVMRAWGFRPVTAITWGKQNEEGYWQTGLGQYFRGCTEHTLFGVRGSLPYRFLPNGKRAQGRTGYIYPRTQHSAKPPYIHRVAMRVSYGPYLEMFARQRVEGWDAWGNEI